MYLKSNIFKDFIVIEMVVLEYVGQRGSYYICDVWNEGI